MFFVVPIKDNGYYLPLAYTHHLHLSTASTLSLNPFSVLAMLSNLESNVRIMTPLLSLLPTNVFPLICPHFLQIHTIRFTMRPASFVLAHANRRFKATITSFCPFLKQSCSHINHR